MGLLDFFRSEKRDNGNTFLKVSSPLFGANAGVAVDKNSALSFSAVLACVRVISESIGSLPIHTYRVEEDGEVEQEFFGKAGAESRFVGEQFFGEGVFVTREKGEAGPGQDGDVVFREGRCAYRTAYGQPAEQTFVEGMG